ncbi:MAG: ABC transporter ATP-binding protein [Pseudomonadota bacterium]
MSAPLLQLIGVARAFGGVRAIDGLDMAVESGTILGLIGPNGAGKTTAFNVISGLFDVTAGRIVFEGRDINAMPVHRRVAAGICRTFQTPRLFEQMTAIETVMTGRHLRGHVGVLGAMFSIGRKRREEVAIRDSAYRLLERVGLGGQADRRAGALSYGHRRVLEIARALAADPKLLLLDEVTAGLNPVETAEIADLIRSIAAGGVTVILVEHDMRFVSQLCGRVVVLNFGTKIAEGTPGDVLRDPEVVRAYLGQAPDAAPVLVGG